MNFTYFYIKLNSGENLIKTKEFNSTIKLTRPIRNAKFLKISNIFSNRSILLVKCDLIEQNCSLTNIDASEGLTSPSQITFLGYGGTTSDDLIKIDPSRSLINEFTISVKNLNDFYFYRNEIQLAFIKIKIYHE